MKCGHDIYGMTFLLTARALYTSIQTNSMIIGNEITTISITLVNINWFWQLDSLCLPSYTHSIYHNLSLLLTLCLKTTQPDVYYVSLFCVLLSLSWNTWIHCWCMIFLFPFCLGYNITIGRTEKNHTMFVLHETQL